MPARAYAICRCALPALLLAHHAAGQTSRPSCIDQAEAAEQSVYESNSIALNIQKRQRMTKEEHDRWELAVEDESARHDKARIDIETQCYKPVVPPHQPCPEQYRAEMLRYKETVNDISKQKRESKRLYVHDLVTRPNRRRQVDEEDAQRLKEIETKLSVEQSRHKLVLAQYDNGNCGIVLLTGRLEDQGEPAQGLSGGARQVPPIRARMVPEFPMMIPNVPTQPKIGEVQQTPYSQPPPPPRQPREVRATINWGPWWDKLFESVGANFFAPGKFSAFPAGARCTISFTVFPSGQIEATVTQSSGNPQFDHFARQSLLSLRYSPAINFPTALATDGRVAYSRRASVSSTDLFEWTSQRYARHTRHSEYEVLVLKNGVWTSSVSAYPPP